LSCLSTSPVWAQLTLIVPAWGTQSPYLQNGTPLHRVRTHSLTGVQNNCTRHLSDRPCQIVLVCISQYQQCPQQCQPKSGSARLYQLEPDNTRQYQLVPSITNRTRQHQTVSTNTRQYQTLHDSTWSPKPVPNGSRECIKSVYHLVPDSTNQYRAVPDCTGECQAVLVSARLYQLVPGNTRQYIYKPLGTATTFFGTGLLVGRLLVYCMQLS
jgi:hypothetical protein